MRLKRTGGYHAPPFVHNSSHAPGVLMIIGCSLGTSLSTPTETTPPAVPFDSDGD
jgi:hypothetical protein